jgi:hypothetical protein
MNKYSVCFFFILFFINLKSAEGQIRNEKKYFSGIDIKTGIGLPFCRPIKFQLV